MELKGKRILVIGNARSGMGAAKLAATKGAQAFIYDGKAYDQWDKAMQDKINEMKAAGIGFLLGEIPVVETYDLVILSPGVPPDIPIITAAKAQGIQVTGEFEFASWYCQAPIVAITGTNGKTTTTTLIGEMMKAHNPHTFIVGNIGNAFSEAVLDIPKDGVVVAEVSSFQLETADTFHPKVAALLNITPDHLNRHKTMANYCACKYQIFANQSATDFAILNARDSYYEEAKAHTKGQLLAFAIDHEPACGVYTRGEALYENIHGQEEWICNIDELFIKGTHNVENALAAIAVAIAFGVPVGVVRKVLTTFKGVEHRTEYVTEKRGVVFFNDSKATNTDAAIAGLIGLSSLKKPIRLIAGGMDKKISLTDWVKLFPQHVEKVYLIGETKEMIVSACKDIGYTAYETHETLEEAIRAAYNQSHQGDCILLSPACASWDMFESYEQRGCLFKSFVNQLEG